MDFQQFVKMFQGCYKDPISEIVLRQAFQVFDSQNTGTYLALPSILFCLSMYLSMYVCMYVHINSLSLSLVYVCIYQLVYVYVCLQARCLGQSWQILFKQEANHFQKKKSSN